MNKTAIKNYAIWARTQLIESAKQRAFEYEITENGENKIGLNSVGGRLLTTTEMEQRDQLITEIRQKGYGQVMEEAAYTWFNRFIALRFMEVNGYLPSKVRVFTDEKGEFKPEIMKQAMTVELDGLDRMKVLSLLEKQNNEELYKYLLITQCNVLNNGLQYIFEKTANWTELLFPSNLLKVDGIIGRLISDIDESDWDDEVEIIGWFYQYYISEKHEEVIDPLHVKVIKKEDIPAATQLFTTDWVVRYILDNTLGRYWIERHPESKLAEKLTYFVVPQNDQVMITDDAINPQDLKVLDPAVGSGHFLSYAFDVLLEIYIESGWSERDATQSIIENNLYGIDIDDRAVQLACFSVMMKARKYNRRIINSNINLHIIAMKESTAISDKLISFISKDDPTIKSHLNNLIALFSNAKEYGSIISVPNLNYQDLYARIKEIGNEHTENLIDMALQMDTIDLVLPLIKQAEMLSEKYDIVATNPPYMNKYSPKLKTFIYEHYGDYKGDLFSVFVFRAFGLCKQNGYTGFMTPMVWMFIKTYEALRQYIINNKSIASLIQFEYSAYEEATVPLCSFVLRNSNDSIKGCYFRLSDFVGGMDVQRKKVIEAINNRDCGYYYEVNDTSFSLIPGSPIAYWVSDSFAQNYQNKRISDYAEVITGMTIGNNNLYLRLWQEVNWNSLALNQPSMEEVDVSVTNWIPYSKGGPRRNWYGNYDYVVNWREKDNFNRSKTTLQHFYLKEAITWPFITSGDFSARLLPSGFLWDVAGSPCFFRNEDDELYALGMLCSNVANYILKVVNPTINVQAIDIAQIPLIITSSKEKQQVISAVKEAVSLSEKDWNSFENSWNFARHPLVPKCKPASQRRYLLENLFREWEDECNQRFERLQELEERINKYFINIYGLGDDLSEEVSEESVTIRKADLQREIKSLISYAVGCMFGRYSIDEDGICFAGGKWDASRYQSFIPDNDNIIPICDDEYFDDDIVGRFINFISCVYGDETLEKNLTFIADALDGKGTSREVIRNYFINDFYIDHCSTYSVSGSGKRPIYWLFSSGKKNGFKALVYIHRYQPDLLARLRTDYVHEQQERYRTQEQSLGDMAQTATPSERVKLNKRISKLKDQALEIQKYEEIIHHLADQAIVIDLDDGVKVNYTKFQSVLEKLK